MIVNKISGIREEKHVPMDLNSNQKIMQNPFKPRNLLPNKAEN